MTHSSPGHPQEKFHFLPQLQMSFQPYLCLKEILISRLLVWVFVVFSARPNCFECCWHNLELKFSHSSPVDRNCKERKMTIGVRCLSVKRLTLKKAQVSPVTNPPYRFVFHLSPLLLFSEKIGSQEAGFLGRDACGPQLGWFCSPSSARNPLS